LFENCVAVLTRGAVRSRRDPGRAQPSPVASRVTRDQLRRAEGGAAARRARPPMLSEAPAVATDGPRARRPFGGPTAS
jgi:hypothetical protein